MLSWFLPLPPPATLGALEFSLLYDQDNSSLHCTIIKAKVGKGAKLGTTQAVGAFLRNSGRACLTRPVSVIALSICDSDSDEEKAGISHSPYLWGRTPSGDSPRGVSLIFSRLSGARLQGQS